MKIKPIKVSNSTMKNFIKVLMSILILMSAGSSIQAQVQVTEKSKDDAYDAPSSKMIGTWSGGGETWIFNANGTCENLSFARSGYGAETKNGISFEISSKYSWKKKGNTLTLTKVAGGVTAKVSRASQNDYNNLSARKKEEIKAELQKSTSLVKAFYDNEEYTIDYLDNSYMVLKKGWNSFTLENSKAKEKRLKEEEAARAKEREARAREREAKAKEEEAREKAQAEANSMKETRLAPFNQKVSELEAKGDLQRVVDQRAQFPGGSLKYITYLQQNLNRPSDALNENIDGNIKVRFIVYKDGSISEIAIAEGLSDSIDEEVIRVLLAMPNWSPALKNNEPVTSIYYDTIPFKYFKK